jgi:hypothetical protein
MGPVQFPVRLGRAVAVVCTGWADGVAVVHPQASTVRIRRRMVNAVFIERIYTGKGDKPAGFFVGLLCTQLFRRDPTTDCMLQGTGALHIFIVVYRIYYFDRDFSGCAI